MSDGLRRKEFKYKGRNDEDLKAMTLAEFAKISNSSIRRKVKRGLTEEQKNLLKKVKDLQDGKRKKPIKTHARDMPIIPSLLGVQLHVYNGKTFEIVEINSEKLGFYLGEFVQTRRKVSHKAPGVGATRSSKFQSVK